MVPEPFGRALRRIRTERQVSLRQLSRLVHVHYTLISKIENGHHRPSVDLIQRVDDALGAQGELFAMAEASPSQRALKGSVNTPATAGAPPHDQDREQWTSPPSGLRLDTSAEWPTWFGFRLARLVDLVYDWQGSAAEPDALQEFLHQEILVFDATAPLNQQAVHALSRRQALATLAALPLALTVSSAHSLASPAAEDRFLTRCAASLTACWHLLRGADLQPVSQIVSTYLLSLEAIARRSTARQAAAAKLASQAHRICGIVALHHNQLRIREYHCRQAVVYADLASDANSKISALISYASTYFYDTDPSRAVRFYEQALALESSASPLQRSRIHAELSVVYAQVGRDRDALRFADLAQQLYPDHPEQDQSFLYAEFTRGSLDLEQGLTHLALAERDPGRGHGQLADEAFTRVDTTAATTVPDRIRFEVNNHQARMAVLLNDLDRFEVYTLRGLNGVTLLGSVQRHRELRSAWLQAVDRWPREARLRVLGARFDARPIG